MDELLDLGQFYWPSLLLTRIYARVIVSRVSVDASVILNLINRFWSIVVLSVPY